MEPKTIIVIHFPYHIIRFCMEFHAPEQLDGDQLPSKWL